jgi:Ca2+/Na+ antiporter
MDNKRNALTVFKNIYNEIIIFLVTIFIAFWGLVVIFQDYYVPTLTIMCKKYKIPHAVAGGTLLRS